MSTAYQAQELRVSQAVEWLDRQPKTNFAVAPRKFGVSRRRICNRYNCIPSRAASGGHNRHLPVAGEEPIIGQLQGLDTPDFSLKRIEDAANAIFQQRGEPPVGKNWSRRFVQRHSDQLGDLHRQAIATDPQLTQMYDAIEKYAYQSTGPQACETMEGGMSPEEFVESLWSRIPPAVEEEPGPLASTEQWYHFLQQQFGDKNINPANVWNVRETGFRLNRDRNQLLVTDRRDTSRIATSIEAISAAGDHIPPFTIVLRYFIVDVGVSRQLPKGWVMTSEPRESDDVADSGWMQHFEHYSGQKQVSDKRLLLIDVPNIADRFSTQSVQFGQDHGITMISSPSQFSHFLPPLDVKVFQPFKELHAEAVGGPSPLGSKYHDHRDFLVAFGQFFSRAFQTSIISEAFRETGIWPFDPTIGMESARQHALNPPTNDDESSTSGSDVDTSESGDDEISEVAKKLRTLADRIRTHQGAIDLIKLKTWKKIEELISVGSKSPEGMELAQGHIHDLFGRLMSTSIGETRRIVCCWSAVIVFPITCFLWFFDFCLDMAFQCTTVSRIF